MTKRILRTLLYALVIMSFLSGCDKKDEETFNETTLSIDRKGRVHETIVESFNKDYYDVSELEAELDKEIQEYNSSRNNDALVVKKGIGIEDQEIHVSLDFASPEDYRDFQSVEMFVGTISDAYDAGFTMDVTLKGIENGDKIGKVGLMGMSDKHIVILSENVRLSSFSKILYVSANVEVLGDKEARIVNESGGLAYIVLAK